MNIDEIRKNKPEGSTHYYYRTPLIVDYAKRYKFLFFFTEYAVWGDEFGWIQSPWDFDVNDLRTL